MTLRFAAIVFLFATGTILNAGEMDGEWVTVARVRGGEQLLGTPSGAVIKDGKFNTVREGELSEVGDIKEIIGPSPSQYNVKMTGDVEDSGKSFQGIFTVSGDTMFTCVNPTPNGERPRGFYSSKANGNILIVWIRKSTVAKMEFPNSSPAKPKSK